MAEKFTKTPLLSERFDEAIQMALEHHRAHLRKDTTVPYVSHLLAVVAIVLELGGDEDAAIAALLHDAVEDGGGPMMQARIDWRFGCTVGEIVAENSDTDEEPKPSWMCSLSASETRERKRRYLAGIPKKSQGAVQRPRDQCRSHSQGRPAVEALQRRGPPDLRLLRRARTRLRGGLRGSARHACGQRARCAGQRDVPTRRRRSRHCGLRGHARRSARLYGRPRPRVGDAAPPCTWRASAPLDLASRPVSG